MTRSPSQTIAAQTAPSEPSLLSDSFVAATLVADNGAMEVASPAACQAEPPQPEPDATTATATATGSLKLIHGDCLTVMQSLGQFDCIFADPPDNLGLKYSTYCDRLPVPEYLDVLKSWFAECVRHAPIVWFSFNAKWTAQFGACVVDFLSREPQWEYRPCVQVFTFGQHSQRWLGNNHRPLWCINQRDAVFFPDEIRVSSWRQRNGDDRADPRGRVPGSVFDMQYPAEPSPGDVFDFPRVPGNSKQRCDWHPTQLHQELVERAIKLSCKTDGRVLDPFAGTGTTLRVCARIGRDCTTIEMDQNYCEKIAADVGLNQVSPKCWSV
ncbi:MAG TPA: DNA methyltransferase [Lacipirellulaceae bacterium]|jgi:site-specific DNA-methyltransferase (adenine-specific)|nr:DNA methyltransferase [Lacipirellulaceae bacterium]